MIPEFILKVEFNIKAKAPVFPSYCFAILSLGAWILVHLDSSSPWPHTYCLLFNDTYKHFFISFGEKNSSVHAPLLDLWR